MKHRISRNPLSRTSSERRSMLNNMATSLFTHGAIKTTYAKAKAARRFIEPIITRARHDTVHNRRQVRRWIRDAGVLDSIFTSIAPRYKERPGGYVRIIKHGHRRGDDATMVVMELLDREEVTVAPKGRGSSTSKNATPKNATPKKRGTSAPKIAASKSSTPKSVAPKSKNKDSSETAEKQSHSNEQS